MATSYCPFFLRFYVHCIIKHLGIYSVWPVSLRKCYFRMLVKGMTKKASLYFVQRHANACSLMTERKLCLNLERYSV